MKKEYTIGELIEELQKFAPSLRVKIFKDDTIYDFVIDDGFIDRIDFNIIED